MNAVAYELNRSPLKDDVMSYLWAGHAGERAYSPSPPREGGRAAFAA